MKHQKTGRWQDADDLRWAVEHWSSRMGLKAPHVRFRAMRTKWASMSTAGRVTMDTHLLRLPRSLGEYVIVHELVHLLAPNHGRVFKSFLLAYMPDWEARDKRLRLFASRQRRYGIRPLSNGNVTANG